MRHRDHGLDSKRILKVPSRTHHRGSDDENVDHIDDPQDEELQVAILIEWTSPSVHLHSFSVGCAYTTVGEMLTLV